jgi:hypothetical protein
MVKSTTCDNNPRNTQQRQQQHGCMVHNWQQQQLGRQGKGSISSWVTTPMPRQLHPYRIKNHYLMAVAVLLACHAVLWT